MQLPFFFSTIIGEKGETIILPEENSKHIISVLRMKLGDELHLTNGKGVLITASITEDHKKKCQVTIKSINEFPIIGRPITIAISLLKNTSRFEWFLEKATEIGISSIVPLICERTEKQHFRFDRMEGVIESALIQSRQVWKPFISEPQKFRDYVGRGRNGSTGFIAHCVDNEKKSLPHLVKNDKSPLQILIGPEGDFTDDEISEAVRYGFIPVSLGHTRLRTETAGIVAAVMLKQSSEE